MNDLSFEFNSPMTKEDWDKLQDNEMIDTVEVTFNTPSGKRVPFRKVRHGENRNNEYAGCDQFICSNCGIELQGWDRIVRAGFEPLDEIWEFEFNFCPNCGADMRGKTK